MVTVIVAAHNEEAVIGDCLDALMAQRLEIPLEIIVSANACGDATAQIAAERGVTVIDRAEPGKPGALNAAESVASSFPRFYLDADIVVPPHGIEGMVAALASSAAVQAVVPRRRIETAGRPWLVRAYFAINTRLPAFENGLFGRGMIGISESGRARFDAFPLMIADDLFLDSLFSDAERAEVRAVEVVVDAPRRAKELVERLVRVRRGNTELRSAAARGEVADTVRPSEKWAWLRYVVLPDPRLAPAAVAYVAITLLAGLFSRRRGRLDWSGPRERVDVGPETLGRST